VERAPRQEPHAALAVAHRRAGQEAHQGARRPVREPAGRRHARQVGEAVADHQVGVGRSREEGGHGLRRVLTVRVQDHDRVRWFAAREQGGDAGRQRVPLAAVARQGEHVAAARRGHRGETPGGRRGHPVVDHQHGPDAGPQRRQEGGRRRLAVAGDDRGDAPRIGGAHGRRV
jgi:hypothetical protein